LLVLLSALIAASHPSLFFDSSDVPALRSAATTTHAEIASHITQILDQHLNDPPPSPADPVYQDDFRFMGNQVAVWAFGYQITGNKAYSDKAHEQLFTYLNWSDWSNGEGIPPDLNQAHMLIGVAAAYDWIHETLSAADRLAIATRLGTEADKMAVNLPDAWYAPEYMQGHNWIDTAGLGIAALALAGEDARASGWLALAEGNLQKLQMTMGKIPDGTWHEGLAYEGYDLSMAMPFWTALARTGADYTDLGILRGYGKYFLYAGLPDAPEQLILPFGDFTHWAKEMVMQINRYTAWRFRDPLAEAGARRWLNAVGRGSFLPEMFYNVFEFIYYDPTVAPVDPRTLPLDGFFPDIGAAALHSTWDPGDFALGLKAGVYGGHVNFERLKVEGSPAGGWINWGHDHNDDLSFWLFGKGTWLAPEAMGYDAGANTSYTYKANQTAYHNALLVDGQGQLGDIRASDSNWNNPWFFTRVSSPLVTPTGTGDYAIAAAQGAGLFATTLGVSRWDRVAVLARNRYALIHDDLEASSPHAYDWICHFQDGVSVDTASGWVQGIGKKGMSLGVRVVSPGQWTATTGSQTASLMENFDPDAQTSWVRVRPASNVASTQFMMALMPVATSSWASRTRVDALDASDTGAGAVVAPGSILEERWIFTRSGSRKAAGDLVLSGAFAGMAGRDSSGAPVRAVLFGAGSISDQNGSRLLLASATAKAIQATVAGATLAVSGDGIADFQAYAPSASSATVNGAQVQATFESGMVSFPAAAGGGVDAGTPDAGTTDAGTADAGTADAGTADAGATDAGAADAGATDAGTADAGAADAGATDAGAADAGAVPDAGCGNCMPPPADGGSPDAGSAPADGGVRNVDLLPQGCSHGGATAGWLALLGALALGYRRRR